MKSRAAWAANVIAFGHTARRFLRVLLLRNTHVHGQIELAAAGDHIRATAIIRPDPSAGIRDRGHHYALRGIAGRAGGSAADVRSAPAPCGGHCAKCSAELEQEHPTSKENMLSAMGNVDPGVCWTCAISDSGRRDRGRREPAEFSRLSART